MIAPILRQQQRLFTLALQTQNKGIAGRIGVLQQDTQGAHDSASQPPRVKIQQAGILPLPSPRDCHALAMEWAMGTVDLIENHLGAMACLGMARNFAAAAWLSKKENGGQ